MNATQKKLETALVDKGVIDAGLNWQRQAGGRSNHVWHLVQAGLICKLYRADSDIKNPFYPNDAAAELACLTALHPKGLTPRVHCAVKTPLGAALLYDYIQGDTWQDDPAPVASLIESIHRQPSPPAVAVRLNNPSELYKQTMAILQNLPDIGLTNLAPNPNTLPAAATPVLTHTDIVAGNLICTANGLRLIDWQCPAQSDGALDLASFISPAMQNLYRGAPLTQSEITLFLNSFEDPGLVARYHQIARLYHWRIAAYCHWRANASADSLESADYTAARAFQIAFLQTLTP